MLSLVKSFLPGPVSYWLYAGLFAAGLAVGAFAVHKLYQASQVGALKAEISRVESLADKRVAEAQEAQNRAEARALATRETIREVKVYVPTDSACDLGPDVVRLLNRGRQ